MCENSRQQTFPPTAEILCYGLGQILDTSAGKNPGEPAGPIDAAAKSGDVAFGDGPINLVKEAGRPGAKDAAE